MDLNKVMLIGRLTADPMTRTTQQGANVTNFSIATNKKIKGQEKREFHNLVAWNKLSDIISQYCYKGSHVYVEGELITRKWQDDSGATKYRTEILVFNLIMLGNKPQGGTHKYQPQLQPSVGTHDEINIDDIPFGQ